MFKNEREKSEKCNIKLTWPKNKEAFPQFDYK